MDVTATEWTPITDFRFSSRPFFLTLYDRGIQHAPFFLIHDSNKLVGGVARAGFNPWF